MVDPALTEMFRLARKARSETVRREACKDIMDRGGLKAADKLEISGADGGAITISGLKRLTDAELDVLEGLVLKAAVSDGNPGGESTETLP